MEKEKVRVMNKDKWCGNCKHFKDEDANGKGWCEHYERFFRCEEIACKAHCLSNNGWTEITPDNMEEVYGIDPDRLVVQYTGNGCYNIIRMIGDFSATISTMAKCGGYYYYVLPELKIE